MKKYLTITVPLILVINVFSLTQSYAQVLNNDEQAQLAKTQVLLQRQLKEVEGDLDKAYDKNHKIFDDPNGNHSVVKVYIYILNSMLPKHIETFRSWAKTCLNKKEYAVFKETPIKISQGSTFNLASLETPIKYDEDWTMDLQTNMALLINPNFNYYEHLFYLNSYDVSKIIQPRFISKYVSTGKDINKLLNNVILFIGYDFFFIMHEFYHQYYEPGIPKGRQNELAADQYALKKWNRFTATPDSNKFVDEDYIKTMTAILGTSGSLQSFLSSNSQCNTTELISPDVTLKEFDSAFIGLRITELLLRTDSRSFFSNERQIHSELTRAKFFAKLAMEHMKCKDKANNIFCCHITETARQLDEVAAAESKASLYPLISIRPVPNSYLKINPQDAGFIAFNMGNHYIMNTSNETNAEKNYKLAITYYKSANLLNNKSPFTILCNLTLYEIYTYNEQLKDLTQAKVYLDEAKKLNASMNVISDEIMGNL